MIGHRLAHRWGTPFGRWVLNYPAERFALDIGVSQSAVYHWVAGRSSPRDELKERIVEMSGGSVSMNDILRHRREVTR